MNSIKKPYQHKLSSFTKTQVIQEEKPSSTQKNLNKMAFMLIGVLTIGYGVTNTYQLKSNVSNTPTSSYPANIEALIVKEERSQLEPPTREEVIQQRKQILVERITTKYRNIKPSFARQVVELAHLSGGRYNIDPVLLLALTDVESSFNPNAISSAGAVGLIQALPRAHPEKFARIRGAGKSPMDAAVSMDMGSQIYSEYRQKFKGNNILALQQYNGSLKDKSLKYSNKVMRAHATLSAGLPVVPKEENIDHIQNIE